MTKGSEARIVGGAVAATSQGVRVEFPDFATEWNWRIGEAQSSLFNQNTEMRRCGGYWWVAVLSLL